MLRRCRKAQNDWIEGKCKEVESPFKVGKLDAAHRKIRENFRIRRINANIVRDENGKALTESRDKIRRWVEYIKSLYKVDAVADLIENKNEVQNDDKGGFDLKGGTSEKIEGPEGK